MGQHQHGGEHGMAHGGGEAHSGHQGAHDAHEGKRPPTLGGHNQMMVGEETIYLSHLPMFMFDPAGHEHSFQVILEVSLSGPGDPRATYLADRRQHPDVRMYTLQPDEFEMVELDPRNPRRHALTGAIFRGHLERPAGQRPIIPRAVAEVVNIVYFNRLEEHAAPLPQLEYLLFGKGNELFLAHVISRPPDFDQILSVKVVGDRPAALTAEALGRGVRVAIPGRANTPPTRIKAGEEVDGRAQPNGAPTALPLRLRADTEFYFEEGELGVSGLDERQPGAFTFDQTPGERKAGF
jgi:hypothetical protein